MNAWYAQMAQVAAETLGRYMANDPSGPLEEALFKLGREVVGKISAAITGLLARLQGPVAT